MRSNDRRTWQDYFAVELRSWREFRKMSQLQLADAIHYSDSAVAMVETKQRKARPDFVERCDEALQTGGALARLMKELVDRELVPDWMDRWRTIEENATALNSFEPLLVPGLLQTPDYARSLFERGAQATSVNVEEQVSARMERQKLLSSENPPMFVGVIDETVLHRLIGSPKIMHEQLMYLINLCKDRLDVVLQVVPKDTGAYAGLAGSLVIATMDGDEFVYLDTALYGQILESPDDLAIVKRMWESLRAEALPRTASLTLITEVAKQWT